MQNQPPRVNLSVSAKGIEIVDPVSAETLHQISIYQISYCSADAAHNNVFAFISGSCSGPGVAAAAGPDTDPAASGPSTSASNGDAEGSSSGQTPLECHVFLCGKRKVAQTIAMTVAKSFDRAYEIWRSVSHRREVDETRQLRDSERATAAKQTEDSVMNMLIDLDADVTGELCFKDGRSYLQNTWVNFEESEYNLMSNLHKNAVCS